MSAGLFQANGSQNTKPTRFTPIFTNEFFTGLYTQRNPLRAGGGTRAEERYFGSRTDSMISGSNVEVSNRLTPIRRPGNSVFSSASYDRGDYFYPFRLFDTSTETIKVMADSPTLLSVAGTSSKTTVWNKSTGSGQTFMQYVANVLYFGNGVDQKKWVQTPSAWKPSFNYQTVDGMHTYFIDPNGNLQQLTACVIPVTNISITSSVLTVTFNQNVSAILSAGLNLVFAGLTGASFLNNVTDQTITVASVTGTQITAAFVHPNYASTPDAGTCRVIEGGTPLSSSSAPTWNATVMGTTTDNTALWTNRGNPVQNIGIKAPAQQAPTFVIGTSAKSWQGQTYYNALSSIIDSNGNLQHTTTGGKSGAAHPTWATSVGNTTTDSTVTWTMTKTAATMTWQPSTAYQTGDIVVATPSGGVPSVFQLQSYTAAQIFGAVNAHLWYVPTTGAVGAFQKTFPLSLGTADLTATGNSLLFDPPANPAGSPVQWATLTSSGATTGYTTPFPSRPSDYNLVVEATLIIPEAGNYTVSIVHHDGMIWGMGGGATVVSGPSNDPFHNTQTAVNGYSVFGGTNQSVPAGTAVTDTFVVNFPAPGNFPLEIDYAFWFHSGQTLCLYLNGFTPVPGSAPTFRTSGLTAPAWPVFSTAYAPGYATVTEPSGQLVWGNIGTVADFGWSPKTNYLTNAASIVDGNGFLQGVFEPGVTTQIAPTFSQTLNQITPDNPNLIWVNQGKTAVTPAGSISTSVGGWSYALALVNTLTNTVSNAGPVTPYTGSFLGASGVTLTGGLPAAAAIDPQADYVAIFRTKDGGPIYNLIPSAGLVNSNQNTPFTLPLAQYLASGYIDTTPDAGLNTFITAPLNGENTPPPTGLINLTYHLNRVFGSVGNVVMWSSGPDTPVGNGNEGFRPNNSATFPSLVKRIEPTSIGAIVFTVSDVYLLAGKATAASPIVSLPYLKKLGLASYNALAVNGTSIFLMTTDRQFVQLDPGGMVSQVGFPIGDQFRQSNWSPSAAYVTYHVDGSEDNALYVSDGSTGWFRLVMTPSPEQGVMWSPFATIVGGCKAVQSIETSPGVHDLLLGSVAAGPILKRDLTTWQDNGSSYTANFAIGPLILAQPGQIAELAFITLDSMRAGTAGLPSVLLDEISGTFEGLTVFTQDPPQLAPSTSLYAQRFYLSQTQQPALCRHMQIKVSWPAENAQNELLTLTLYGAHAQES